jgi:hypothetical protein
MPRLVPQPPSLRTGSTLESSVRGRIQDVTILRHCVVPHFSGEALFCQLLKFRLHFP